MQRCSIETKILRGCVANDTQVVRFVRYPPGPLRSKNGRDVTEKFQYIEKAYLAVASDPVVVGGAGGDGSSGVDTSNSASNACAKPGASFAHLLPLLTSAPYSVSLRDIPPFNSILGGGGDANRSSSSLLRYVDYACLAAVEHALELIDAATESNGQGKADLSVRRAEFFLATAHAPGLYHFDVSDAAAAAGGADCPSEKDTTVVGGCTSSRIQL